MFVQQLLRVMLKETSPNEKDMNVFYETIHLYGATVLCILTSKWVLCMPFVGRDHLSLRENKLFSFSITNRKKKGKCKNNKEKQALKGSTSILNIL